MTPSLPQATPAVSPIADLSYRNYNGPLQSRAVRWWIVALATIRANVNRSRFGYWIPAVLIMLTYLIRGIVFYVTLGVTRQAESMGMNVPNADETNIYAREFYGAITQGIPLVNFTPLLVFIAALVVGASSIAADNRANALLVYLSKPLTRFDYVMGKWMGIFILLSSLLLVPSLLTYLFFVAVYTADGFLKDYPFLVFKVILACLIPAAIHTSLILGFSAWSKSGRVTGAIYAAFYLIFGVLAFTLGNVLLDNDKGGKHLTRSEIVLHSSVNGATAGLLQHTLGVAPTDLSQMNRSGRRRGRRERENPAQTESIEGETAPKPKKKKPGTPPLWSMLLIGGTMIAAPIAAAAYKVRAVEVVRG